MADETKTGLCDDASLLSSLKEHGWASLSAFSVADLIDLARRLGPIVHQPTRGAVSALKPIDSKSARPSSASATYGLGRFPFHTDLAHWPRPPRYVVMGNVGCTSNVPALLLDSFASEVFQSIDRSGERSLWSVGKASRPFVSSLYFRGGEARGLRWDINVMSPINELASKIGVELWRALENGPPVGEVKHEWHRSGRAVVVDNWRVLHARPPVPDAQANRLLHRIFVAEGLN